MAKLHIDTLGMKKSTIRLEADGIMVEESSDAAGSSQALLPLVDKVLRDMNLHVSDLTEITVAAGSGSFTGFRVGMSVAKSLAFLMGIPVNSGTATDDSSIRYGVSKFDG
jgi:tRNA threonylcarbamoyladenosine biosynthesis protein TsaB